MPITCVQEYSVGMRAVLVISCGVARCSRERSFLVILRDGGCDNGDATFDGIPFSYIGVCVIVMGEVEVAACHLSFERAQLLRRAMR